MASTYLSRTPSSTGNQKTYTFSGWIKRSGLSSNNQLFGARYGDSSREAYFLLDANNKLNIFSGDYSTSATTISMQLITDRVFRDTNAWYHIVIKVDTTQATASDRVKLYINGVQETSFGTETYPDQNDIHFFNITTTQMQVGALNGGNTHNGSMAHVHFIDGTAYDASAFGETDATTGIWKPKTAPSVTYGTNGFFLKFENSGSMGTDSSGNSNNFTVNGSITQNVDTPSNNFCTLTPLRKHVRTTLTHGNLTSTNTSVGSWQMSSGSQAFSKGKYYFEFKITTLGLNNGYHKIGFISENNSGHSSAEYPSQTAVDGGYVWYSSNGSLEVRTDDSVISGYDQSTLGVSFALNDIMCLAIDMTNKRAYFRKNGDAWIKSADPVAGTNGLDFSADYPEGKYLIPAVAHYNLGAGSVNFGSGFFGTTAVSSAGTSTSGDDSIWEFDCPTGYYGINTKNINLQEYS